MIGALDYSLCDQTVTVYRYHGGQVLRFVEQNCYFAYQEVSSLTRSGAKHIGKCLLIMPGQVQKLFPGDRVLCGVGPVISDADWQAFIPAKVAGLVQLTCVKPYYLEGALCHVEAIAN